MTINAELADKIRTIIDMRPGVHDQGNWFFVYDGDKDVLTPEDVHVAELLAEVKENEEKGVSYTDFEPTVSCNATLCVAGWACLLEGYTLTEDENNYVVAKKGDEQVRVQDKGAELLGLEREVADWLFCQTDDDQAIDALADMAVGELPSEFSYERDDYCCSECDGY